MPVAKLKVQKAGIDQIVGTAKPGARIELIDLSNAPKGRLHIDDIVVAGKANANGKFTADVDERVAKAMVGNLVRLRAVDTGGKATRWLDVRLAKGNSRDKTNAFVAMFRLEPTYDEASGKIRIVNNNDSRPISEPGAKLRFINARTGASADVTIDGKGQLKNGKVTLAGKPGDELRVAVSDGTNNRDFKKAFGKLEVPGKETRGRGRDIADPALQDEDIGADGIANYEKKRFPIDWDLPDDFVMRVFQGNIGNCFFPGAVAAIADANLDYLRNLASVSADKKSLTFRFEVNGEPKTVTIDGDLYVRASGELLYGRDRHFALLEKAYAKAAGSYQKLGEGGSAANVIADLTGKAPFFEWLDEHDEAGVWKFVKNAVKKKLPACFSTHSGEEMTALYSGTGVYANHAYSLLDCREVNKNGKTERYVTVRNPWGESEPDGNGPNDGVFELPLKKVMRYFDMFLSVT